MSLFDGVELTQMPARQIMTPTDKTVAHLRSLVELLPKEWDKSKFVLCGSASLAVHGFRDVHDLDVLVLPELWPEVKAKFPDTIPRGLVGTGHALTDDDYPNDDNDHALVVNGTEEHPIGGVPVERTTTRKIELWRVPDIDFFDGLIRPVANNKQVFKDAVMWEGYLVLSLRHCLAVKALGWRAKDKADIVRALLDAADEDLVLSLADRINSINTQWVV